VDLTKLHGPRTFQVARRFKYDEDRVAVALHLGSLVSIDRVLDRQLVQVELTGDGDELLLGRLVETDPGEATLVATRAVYAVQRTGSLTETVYVDGDVYDHLDKASGINRNSDPAVPGFYRHRPAPGRWGRRGR
jgi:hypothetical protein